MEIGLEFTMKDIVCGLGESLHKIYKQIKWAWVDSRKEERR